jgi:hypothetical protein
MKIPVVIAVLALTSTAYAADDRYTLDLGASVQGSSLKVEPTLTGPAGKTVDYQMRVRREGGGNSSNSSQGGTVQLDRSGHAQLASNSVSVSPSDRYVVTVRVMDGGKVVAEKSQQYP